MSVKVRHESHQPQTAIKVLKIHSNPTYIVKMGAQRDYVVFFLFMPKHVGLVERNPDFVACEQQRRRPTCAPACSASLLVTGK